MDPLTISAIVAGGSALLGSVFNLFSSKKTNDTQKEMMQAQNQFNEEMIDKQNQYNSYANQSQLMQEAGLNPAFLFGTGNLDANQPSPATGASLPNLTPPQFDAQTPAQLFLDAKRLQNETARAQADTTKTYQEAESFRIANSQAEEQFKNAQDKIKADTSLSDAERQFKLQQIETEKARQQELYRSAENLRYNSELLQQKAITEGWSQKKLSAEFDRLVKLTPIEASELASRAKLNISQANLAAETINKVKYEVVKTIKEGRNIDALTMSQMFDNALKDVTTHNKINLEQLKGENELLNLVYSECDGIVGSIAKSLAVLSQAGSATFGMSERSNRTSKMINTQSSWLFNR